MLKIGFKLWSTNIAEILPRIRDSYEQSFFDYIELYFVPGTPKDMVKLWGEVKIPMIIHAPHNGHGFNLADQELAAHNARIFDDVIRCADAVGSDTIIVHGGNSGTKEETIRQINLLKECRIIIENKPMRGLRGEQCIGFIPEDIADIVNQCRLKGFVFDFIHAVCAARSLAHDPMEFIQKFLAQKPLMFHLCDGDYCSEMDTHLHFGQGSMPIGALVAFLTPGARVTLETPNDFSQGFNGFEVNRNYIVQLLKDSVKKAC